MPDESVELVVAAPAEAAVGSAEPARFRAAYGLPDAALPAAAVPPPPPESPEISRAREWWPWVAVALLGLSADGNLACHPSYQPSPPNEHGHLSPTVSRKRRVHTALLAALALLGSAIIILLAVAWWDVMRPLPPGLRVLLRILVPAALLVIWLQAVVRRAARYHRRRLRRRTGTAPPDTRPTPPHRRRNQIHRHPRHIRPVNTRSSPAP